MQYTRARKRKTKSDTHPGVYADLDELMRLRFKATGFSFLPRQPIHNVLSGQHASKLRGRGLNFEELRNYLPGGLVTGRPAHFHVLWFALENEIPGRRRSCRGRGLAGAFAAGPGGGADLR